MRIFYASERSPNAIFESNLWRNNLYLPLVDLGHDVVEFDYDLRETFQKVDGLEPSHRAFINRNRPKVTAELLRQIKKNHAIRPIELFFSYFYDACILPEAIDEIRSLGIKTVNWFCNGSYQLHLVKDISPHFNWCLVPEKFRLSDYMAMGAHPIYCQEAANPNIYKPYDLPQEFDVTFVGQAYGERPSYIHHLLGQGINVLVWGFGWGKFTEGESRLQVKPFERIARAARKLLNHEGRQLLLQNLRKSVQQGATVQLPPHILGGLLSDLELIQMYSRSKINLGFSSCGDTYASAQRIVQVRLRDFEVPMSGGFYMVEYMEELEEFYDIGKEIVCYSGEDDLVEKIKYYLSHDSERDVIRRAGQQRCLRDHTWHRRFEMAFKEMGLF